MNRLSERGYLAKREKHEEKQGQARTTEEIDLLDTMLSSLVEVLERKGILTEDEWEKQIKQTLKKLRKNHAR